MYVVGITGGIAMGKSEAVKIFRGMEIPVWEADEASREVCRPGQAGHQAIRNAYGDAFFAIDGSLERKKLGQYVFGKPEEVEKLNSLLHPLVLGNMRHWLKERKLERKPLVMVSASLLWESGADTACDEVWTFSCGMDEQIRRLQKRDGLDLDEALARIEAQMPDNQRRSASRRIVDTSGNLEDTARYLRTLVEELLEEVS